MLLAEDEAPRREINDHEQPVISYVNWRGETVHYSDIHS
jgi:hypothetical protein